MGTGPYITATQIKIIAQKVKLESKSEIVVVPHSYLHAILSFPIDYLIKVLVIQMFYMECYYIIYTYDLLYISYVINSPTPFQ